MSTTEARLREALRKIVPLVREYLDASEDHYAASFADDSRAAEKANRRAERCFANLNPALQEADAALALPQAEEPREAQSCARPRTDGCRQRT